MARPIPIGSMVLPYMVTFTINIPQMLAYIYIIYIYHTWILWDMEILWDWTNLQGSLVGSSLIAANVAGRRPSL